MINGMDPDQLTSGLDLLFALFDLILYVPVNNFQLCRKGLPGLNQY